MIKSIKWCLIIAVCLLTKCWEQGGGDLYASKSLSTVDVMMPIVLYITKCVLPELISSRLGCYITVSPQTSELEFLFEKENRIS